MEEEADVYTPSATTTESPGFEFRSVMDVVTEGAKAVGDVAGSLLTLQRMRDSLADTREDRVFQKWLRGEEVKLARDKATIGAEVERVKAMTVLEQARAALSPVSFRWDIALAITAAAIGAFALVRAARGR